MSEYQSTEYSYRASPQLGLTTRMEGGLQLYKFTWASAAAGAANDTILLRVMRAYSTVYMIHSFFEWTNFTATATIDIGWQEYTDADGTVVDADEAGLIDGVLLTTASTWGHGMLLTATPDDSKPVVNRKDFNNRSEVTLFATIKVAAPGATATLSGAFAVAHS